IYSRVSRGIRPLYGCWVYSLYCVYPLSIREESRTIYPLNTGEKLAERARIGIEPVGPYAYGTHEHKMRGPGARVSHAGPCPSHTGPRPATPIQLSVRWDRQGQIDSIADFPVDLPSVLIHALGHCLLGFFHVVSGNLPGFVHPSRYRKGFSLIQFLGGASGLWGIPVPASPWIKTELELIRRHANGGMGESHLHSIHQGNQFAPVVLVIRHKGSKPLIDIAVHDFSLAVCLLVIRRRQLDLDTDNST